MQQNGFRILIADDEPDILEILSYNLENEGYQVITASDGNEAIEKAEKYRPHLIILDMMMPGKSGVQVCRILRGKEAFNDTLIMFLTALNDEFTQVRGLESGADDYVSKPISPKVLLSKVSALLRRVRKENKGIIKAGAITIDPEKYIVIANDKEVVLAKKEFELLYLLAIKPGRVFLRNEILSAIWGNDVIVGDRTIDVHIRKIRQKLDIDCITTVKGVGYKFE
ncbi:MAG TPA: response regulator transcription factor [Niabella sp.]|jgi:two-component system alkaline phosphatase synthesis response regulator PhoP|nr:response regulator transcription factor [Chitinophagaceae bacterium]HRN47015.1 response regulator transcription factor [Niabella sp.]HRO83724.1 response regulator transcription factor [Niabella sp.]